MVICCLILNITLITSLAMEVMFLVALVSLFVCLFVDNITQNVMSGLKWNVMEGSRVVNFGGDLGILRWVNKQKTWY